LFLRSHIAVPEVIGPNPSGCGRGYAAMIGNHTARTEKGSCVSLVRQSNIPRLSTQARVFISAGKPTLQTIT